MLIAYAAGSAAEGVARGFLAKLNAVIIYPLITLMLAIALVIFLWGAFEFIMGATEPTKREQGKRHLLWGIVGMLIMVSALAILNVAAGTFGVSVYTY